MSAVETAQELRLSERAAAEIGPLEDLVESVFFGELDLDVRENFDRETDATRTSFDPERDFVLAAHAGEEFAGGLLVTHQRALTTEAAQLSWLVVAPPYRRRGLGRALLARGLELCRERRVPVVKARCIVHRSAPIRLYWELGFRVSAITGVLFHDRVRETIVLEKRLTLPPARC